MPAPILNTLRVLIRPTYRAISLVEQGFSSIGNDTEGTSHRAGGEARDEHPTVG